jgi:hypothetical protein
MRTAPLSILLLTCALPGSAANYAQATQTASQGLCFEELVQVYEWNDGGFDWRTARKICEGPLANDPGNKARTEGRIEVTYRDGDVRVVSSTSRWTIEHTDGRPCAGARQLQMTETKVLRDGQLHIVKTKAGREVERSSKPAHANASITVAGMPRVPPNDPQVAVSGNEPAFGYQCQRVQPRANPGMSLCTLPVRSSCKSRSAMQPIEMRIVDPVSHTVIHEGKTTEFRTGKSGSLVKPQDIVVP